MAGAGEGNARAVSVRVSYIGGGKAAGQRRHDLREGRVPAYVDGARSAQNSVIVEPWTPAQLRDECERRRALRPHQRRMRRNAAVAVSGIITFGVEAQREIEALTPDQQDRYALRAAEAVCDRMGTTLSGLVAHRDETGIHWHWQAVAYTHDGACLSHERECGLYSALQDTVAGIYADLGIERGYSKHDRLAAGAARADVVHRQVRELHDLLPTEIAAAQASLERNQRLLAQTEDRLAAGRGNVSKLKARADRYQSRIEKAEAVLAALPTPSPVVVERVKSRQKRLLRPDDIKTQRVKVYPVQQVQRAMRSMADQTARAEQRATQAEREAADARERAEAETQERVRQDEALQAAGQALHAAGLPRPDDPLLQPGYDAAAWQAERAACDREPQATPEPAPRRAALDPVSF